MLINQTGLKCSESTFSYLLDIFPIPRSILSLKTWNVLIYFTVCIPRYVAPCVLHVAAASNASHLHARVRKKWEQTRGKLSELKLAFHSGSY